jgi:hypothetical protein
MTRPADDGPPPGNGRPPRRPAPSSRPRGPADLAGEVQRWLIKSGARNMRREFGEQVRRTLGGPQPPPSDVWEVATTEPPPEERFDSPECAWCPVCRAARRARESGPGLGSQLSGASDLVASAVADALSAFDAVLGAGTTRSGTTRSGTARSRTAPSRPDPARPAPPPAGQSQTEAPAEPAPAEQPPAAPRPPEPGRRAPRPADADSSVWATAVRDPAAGDTTVPREPAQRPEEEPTDEPDDRG